MKHIKTYQLFESVEETKNWISEVMRTCKDIMIELEDVDIKTDVKRSLQSYKSILIECTMFISNGESISRFRNVMQDSEIKSRLIDYMQSEGFELVDYSPYIRDGQFKMSFKKSDIDSDYIAHLRFLTLLGFI
jgi:hypothetical protein